MNNIFKKIGNKLTLSKQIQQKIEEAILKKQFTPGEKLPTEKEMCEMFGVSRTALREALQMLSSQGLITVRKGSGIYINDYAPSVAIEPMSIYLELNFDIEYVLHVIKVRKILEPEITRMAAQNRNADHLKEMDENLIAFKKVSTNNFKREGELDCDFHRIIARATMNPIIPLIVDPIFRLMPKIRTLVYAEINKARSSALFYHELIVEKIRNKDEEGAFRAMTDHLKIAEEHSLHIVKSVD